MDRRITIATTQLDAAPAPVPERLVRAESLVMQAAQAGAQLVVLPELFNTGYAYRNENFALAESSDGRTAQWMKQTSSRLGVHLAGSLLLRDGRDIYNALLLYAPDGRVWRYDKNYPWGWERAYFREGHAVCIAETDLGAIGMMLCWDMAHADLWRQYAGKVDLILACSCPPNVPDGSYHFPDGSQVTGAQMGPMMRSMRQSAPRIFEDTPAQQTAWLGVPFVGSTACGVIRTPLPNPVGSLMGFLPTAPWLIRYLPQLKHVEVSASLVEAARIFAADGQPIGRTAGRTGRNICAGGSRPPGRTPAAERSAAQAARAVPGLSRVRHLSDSSQPGDVCAPDVKGDKR